MSMALKKLKVLESRYLFLIKRIKENPNQHLSFDEREATSLRWAIEELSPKYNFNPNNNVTPERVKACG